MLPREYTRVEYIESTGSQHVDIKYTPSSQKLRIVCEFELTASMQGKSLFGAESNGQFPITFYGNTASTASFYVGSTFNVITLSIAQNTKYVLDCRSENGALTVTINGITYNGTYTGDLLSTRSIMLFSNNLANNISLQAISARVSKFIVYDNGILVRDIIPSINAAGTVGLYDLVTSTFYANSGSGAFTAGPAIPRPSAPGSVRTAVSVLIKWEAPDGATSYNIYRNGELIGTTEFTQFVDTDVEENKTYTYGISAVGDGGEGTAAQLIVYTRTGYFMYKPVVQTANFP